MLRVRIRAPIPLALTVPNPLARFPKSKELKELYRPGDAADARNTHKTESPCRKAPSVTH